MAAARKTILAWQRVHLKQHHLLLPLPIGPLDASSLRHCPVGLAARLPFLDAMQVVIYIVYTHRCIYIV